MRPPKSRSDSGDAGPYELVAPDDCDVVVALGGDGLLLHAIHELLQPGRPIFGMAATYTNGHRDHALAVNEVAVTRLSVHSANIRSRQHRLRSLVAALLRASYR